MDAAEAAVGEHGDDIAGAGVLFDFGDDGFDIGEIETAAAEAGDVGGEFGGIEADLTTAGYGCGVAGPRLRRNPPTGAWLWGCAADGDFGGGWRPVRRFPV